MAVTSRLNPHAGWELVALPGFGNFVSSSAGVTTGSVVLGLHVCGSTDGCLVGLCVGLLVVAATSDGALLGYWLSIGEIVGDKLGPSEGMLLPELVGDSVGLRSGPGGPGGSGGSDLLFFDCSFRKPPVLS